MHDTWWILLHLNPPRQCHYGQMNFKERQVLIIKMHLILRWVFAFQQNFVCIKPEVLNWQFEIFSQNVLCVFIMSIFEMYWPAPLLCTTMHVLFVCIDRKYNFNVKGYSARVEGIGLAHIILSVAFLYYYILYTYNIFTKKGRRQVPQIACLKFCQKCDKKWYSVVRIQFGFLI